jgi:RimJ/RimL family protein N-acetyltransferase
VQLTPLSESDFQAYLAINVPAYAQDQVKTGKWHPSEAMQKAQEEYQELLPDGLATKEQYLFSLEDVDTGAKVGIIFFGLRGVSKVAMLYDFLVFEQFRRQGYGMHAMRALEEQVKHFGIQEIHLHVFAHNHAARALYEQLGYQVTNLYMSKKLNNQEGEE